MSEETEKDIKSLLLPGEKIIFIANQARIRPGGSLVTPDSIYVTNRRVLWRNPRWLGLKKDYNDSDYRDISNIRMKKGIFSTEIFLHVRFLSDPIKLPAIPKGDAEQVNILVRKGIEGELPGQLISEERTAPIIKRAEKEDYIEQLERLAKLKEKGIITEEEFQTKKKELLNKS